METRIAVQNALWPALFQVIAQEVNSKDDPDPRLNSAYSLFESDFKSWVDKLKKHQLNAFEKNIKRNLTWLIDLCRDKQAMDGKGGNNTTKTVGVYLAIIQNVPLDFTDDFKSGIEIVSDVVYHHLGKEWDAQFESGSIEKQAVKAIEHLKGMGYYAI